MIAVEYVTDFQWSCGLSDFFWADACTLQY